MARSACTILLATVISCWLAGTAHCQSGSDPDDLTFVNKWAAIGDSYAAGIGAGNQIDKGCARYDSSYPNLINSQLGKDTTNIEFSFIACSGANVPAVLKQSQSLDDGQQMITISAGGIDAGLVNILNDCIYTFYGGFSGNCDNTLANSEQTIDSSDFAANLDGLISNAKSKLAPGGFIYYTGYAQFFDATTNDCDSVSWKIWVSLFSRQYLTQARRQAMNSLVVKVNNALQAAVQRAGDQVVFIDYDDYVGFLGGRFCLPGLDESKGNGANRDYLFFYEMNTKDTPFMPQGETDPFHDETKRRLRRDTPALAANDTLDGQIGYLIHQTIAANPDAQLDDTVANPDLDASVASQEGQQKVKRQSTARLGRHERGLRSRWVGNGTYSGCAKPTASGIGSGGPLPSGTSCITGHNQTQDGFVTDWLAPDGASRAFHPQQGGHAMIANRVLYNMAWKNAASMGLPIPPQNLTLSDSSCPLPPSPACDGDSTDRWVSRTGAISAVSSFCSFPQHLAGSTGKSVTATYNHNTLDNVQISIDWKDDFAIGESQCNSWFGTVVDGCDTNSDGNVKHGGSIGYATNATLSVDPLVIQREWDGGRTSIAQCNGISTDNYLDQATLAGNIQDFCTKSAAQNISYTGSTFSQEYNQGTPDHVTLVTTWPTSNYNFQIFEEECNYYLMVIMNSCDIPDQSNPMNWKHGGSMKDNNKITYVIEPMDTRPPAPKAVLGACTSWYKGLYANFEVWGAGFANSDFGQAPGGLLDQLRGCGVVTGWGFDYVISPSGDGTEWHAYGALPIGTRGCVQSAVISAGGPDLGGCGGSG